MSDWRGCAEQFVLRACADGREGCGDRAERRFPFTLGSQCVTAAKWPGQLRPAAAHRAKLMPGGALPGGACEVGGDDVGGVPVQAAAGAVIPHRGARVACEAASCTSRRIVVRGSACEAASCTSRSGTPASKLVESNVPTSAEYLGLSGASGGHSLRLVLPGAGQPSRLAGPVGPGRGASAGRPTVVHAGHVRVKAARRRAA